MTKLPQNLMMSISLMSRQHERLFLMEDEQTCFDCQAIV